MSDDDDIIEICSDLLKPAVEPKVSGGVIIDSSVLQKSPEVKIQDPVIVDPVVITPPIIMEKPAIYHDIVLKKHATTQSATSLRFCIELIEIGIREKMLVSDGMIIRIVEPGSGVILHTVRRSNSMALIGSMLVMGLI
jgi:hypothetical protein